MAFLALGDVIAARAAADRALHATPTPIYVWGILAGSAVGLLASTLGRLYSSTYYALRDTRTPLRYALVRVALTTVLGYLFAIPLPRLARASPASWGAAGLTASAGIAGWVEMLVLRRTLNARIGRTGLPARLRREAVDGRRSPAAAVAWGVEARAAARSHPVVGGRSSCSARTALVFFARDARAGGSREASRAPLGRASSAEPRRRYGSARLRGSRAGCVPG